MVLKIFFFLLLLETANQLALAQQQLSSENAQLRQTIQTLIQTQQEENQKQIGKKKTEDQ